MQTPKTSIKSSSESEGGRRISSRSVNSDTSERSSSRVVRQLKTTSLEVNSCTSIRPPKTSSPRITGRTSPRGSAPELRKKHLGRVAELETQVTELEDALRTVKDQLIVSESWKKQAKIDAEESRKELLAVTLRLEESQKILARSCSSKAHDEHDDEAHKLKLEGNRETKSLDSAALATALLEVDQLKVKLSTLTESEATQTRQAESAYVEVRILKENMSEALSLMEAMKNQLEDCRSSESQAQALASETLLQLETAKKTMESFKLKSYEYNAVVLELKQSRARVSSLEEIINKMKSMHQKSQSDEEESSQTLEIMAELKRSKEDIEELKANLMDKETELQCVHEENENLNTKLANMIWSQTENESKQVFKSLKTEMDEKLDEKEKLKLEIKKLNGFMEALKQDFNILKSQSIDVESELYEMSNENEILKQEIKKMNGVMEASKEDFNSLKSKLMTLETKLCEKSNENEKLKLEIKKSNDEVTQVTERLKAVKIRNSETEEELRKLKVQMGQWRKAAEAATAMLCNENTENNDSQMLVDRTWSMGHFSPMKTPCSAEIDNDNDDDEFLKRKNGNVLKRIGVLWKKPQNN